MQSYATKTLSQYLKALFVRQLANVATLQKHCLSINQREAGYISLQWKTFGFYTLETGDFWPLQTSKILNYTCNASPTLGSCRSIEVPTCSPLGRLHNPNLLMLLPQHVAILFNDSLQIISIVQETAL